jgi:hypothetical protein
MCEWKPDFDALNKRVDGIETRMTQVEHDVGKMRTETQDGFRQGAETMRQLNTSISNLAHDFGSRMNAIDARLVEEKVRWGDTLRKILMWAVRVILVGALAAMGLTAYKTVFGG